MAASADSIKKVMDLADDGAGTIDMVIRLRRTPSGFVTVDGRPCGDPASIFTNPALATQGITETVVATVTEFIKAAKK